MKISERPSFHSMNIKNDIAKLAEKYHLTAIYAFGSRCLDVVAMLEGTKTSAGDSASDIDIGVLLPHGTRMDIKEKVRITAELEDLLRVERVDLLVLQEADPFLAANIIRGEKIYCNNEDIVDEYELYVLRRAGDLIPLEEERIRLILKKDP